MGLLFTLLEDMRKEQENKRMQEMAERHKQLINAEDEHVERKPQKIKEKKETKITSMEQADEQDLLEQGLQEYLKEQCLEKLIRRAKACCENLDLEFKVKGDLFFVSSDAGGWYFSPLSKETKLYHRNYSRMRNTPGSFHIQYQRTESLEDTLRYIYRHDRSKKRREKRQEQSLLKREGVI